MSMPVWHCKCLDSIFALLPGLAGNMPDHPRDHLFHYPGHCRQIRWLHYRWNNHHNFRHPTSSTTRHRSLYSLSLALCLDKCEDQLLSHLERELPTLRKHVAQALQNLTKAMLLPLPKVQNDLHHPVIFCRNLNLIQSNR